jgi:phosphohistidine swiveling domain-containing protein
MTEWLLNIHNTQESSGVACPVSTTMIMESVDRQVHWFLRALGGDISDFDPALHPLVVVQGQLYGNLTFYAQNMSAVLPTDPESIGVPAEIVVDMASVPFKRMALLPFRFRNTYRWMVNFHDHEFPEIYADLHRRYWAIRDAASPEEALPLIWPLFDETSREKTQLVDQGRVMAAIVVMIVDKLLRDNTPTLINLFSGQDTSISAIGMRLWELRKQARDNYPGVVQQLRAGETDLAAYQALPDATPFLTNLQAFLHEYGHRGFQYELDLEVERLADRPDIALMAVAALLDENIAPQVRVQAARERAELALETMPFLQRALWKRVLHWGQNLIEYREAFKSALSLNQALYGLAAQVLARHFYPQEPDDVLLLHTIDEYMAFGRSRGSERVPMETLQRRRIELKLRRSRPLPADIIWFDPETERWRPAIDPKESGEAEKREFQGIPAGATGDAVEGVALVTNDPVDAGRRLLEIQGPVILVTHLTDPAWSSLFARLTAIVTELGGVISHAAIVARENGLPCVVGVPEATQYIRDGQQLNVDGSSGVIRIL